MRGAFLFVAGLFFAEALYAQARPPVVINEILFNPNATGSDYIELYNRSDSAINLQTLQLSNRAASGPYGPLKKLVDTAWYLLPQAYVVFTEDAAQLRLQYFVKDAAAVIEVASLPSYPNSAGTVVLLDTALHLVDAVAYNEDWQFALLPNTEGVALERIDPNGVSNDKSNWHSAASEAGYGTPGYQNSQYQLFKNPMPLVGILPKIFSPDGDGIDDALFVTYTVPQAGFTASVFVFDASGKKVRNLAQNAGLGAAGKFVWDGRDDRGDGLPAGHYIIYTELFNLQGKTHRFKLAAVLARRP